jgi:hypothetical protein
VETGALACRPTRRSGPLPSAPFESLALSRQCWLRRGLAECSSRRFGKSAAPFRGGGQARAPVATLDGLRPSIEFGHLNPMGTRWGQSPGYIVTSWFRAQGMGRDVPQRVQPTERPW